jgi:hypothetical protein
MCWVWYRGGTERVDEVEVCEILEVVCEVLEVVCLKEEDEMGVVKEEEVVVEKREGKWRDEWECDFCGVECFCKFQRFSEVE